MPECIDCGATVQNKNAAGHYREKCWDCIEAASCIRDERRTITEMLEGFDAR